MITSGLTISQGILLRPLPKSLLNIDIMCFSFIQEMARKYKKACWCRSKAVQNLMFIWIPLNRLALYATYFTRADLTGRDWASCEKGGCTLNTKTRWLLQGKQVWSVTGKEKIHMQKKEKRHVEQTWLSQIHVHAFTVKLIHNDNMLLTIISCCRINQMIGIIYKNSPHIFSFYFCLVIVMTNILKVYITDLELYQQN